MPAKPTPAPAPSLSDSTATLVVGAVAIAASAAGVLNQFAQDDLYLIQDNVRLHSLTNLRDIVATPFWPPPWSQDLYRPLTSLLLAVEYALGSGAPLLFRLVSVLLYTAVAIGLFRLARRLLPRPVALAAALLFAAHPVHVEAVALGVGQSELLVALLAVVMAIRYLDRRRAGGLAPRDWGWLLALYLAASLTKEHGLAIPGLLLALEVTVLHEPARERLRKLGPGYLGLAAVAMLVLLLRSAVLGGEVAGTFVAEALDGVSPGGRLLTMLAVVPRWGRLLLWPAHLQADYSPQELLASSGFGVMEGVGAVILLAAVAAAWLVRRRAPVVTFGLIWTAVALFPVSNVLIPTGILLAERTLFLASAGVLLAAGGAAAALWPVGAAGNAPAWRRVELVCALLVMAGVVRSGARYRDWRSEAWYAVRGVQDAPRSFRMRRAYGDLLFELGQRELALAAYQEAIALAPKGHAWQVRNDFARRFRVLGESQPELEQLRLSLAERPNQEETRGWLVAASLALGRYAEAASEADSAMARGGKVEVFSRLRNLADSAAKAGAPAGSIRIGIVTGGSRPIRPGQ